MKKIPLLGVGLSFRSSFGADVFLHQDKIDFLEIIADHYIDVPPEKMEELNLLKRNFTLIPHAINLSLGSSDELDQRYLEKLSSLIEIIDPPYWSEHISFSKIGDIEIGHLSPMPFTHASIEILTRNIGIVKSIIRKPLILENISYLVNIPGAEMTEGEFLSKLFSHVDAGLLLDVTNLFYNSQNNLYNVEEFLNKIPLEKIVQLHFTGGMYRDGKFIDNHSCQTPQEVWCLMQKILSKTNVKGLILERDDSNPDFNEILVDIIKARNLLKSS